MSAAINTALLEALQAEEVAQWAMRNYESFSDPLGEGRLNAKIIVEMTRNAANALRKAALAEAEGRAV